MILLAFYSQAEMMMWGSKIEALIAQRNTARANKDWASADSARDQLNALNIILEDGPKEPLGERLVVDKTL